MIMELVKIIISVLTLLIATIGFGFTIYQWHSSLTSKRAEFLYELIRVATSKPIF